jgi:RecB family endonuclease NucS
LGHKGLELFGSENDIVELIARNPGIVEEGATLVTREARTPYGRADLILRGRDGVLIVVEVKRSRADVPAVYQLMRYVEYFRSLGLEVRGYLASPSVTPAATKALNKAGLKHVRIEPPKRI